MGACVSTDEKFDYETALSGDRNTYSVEVKGEDMKDCSRPRRHKDFVDRLVDAPYDGNTDEEKCSTVWHAFQRGLRLFPQNKCMGMRRRDGGKGVGEFLWATYEQTNKEVLRIAAGMLSLGLKKGDAIGICSANRPEWSMVALAAYSQGIVVVALYDTLGADAVEYIMNHAEIRVAFCSNAKLSQILSAAPNCPNLKNVVQFDVHPVFGHPSDAIKEADRKQASEKNVKLAGLGELEEAGGEAKVGTSVSSKDLAFIMYTSGTTGVPKGALLLHGNIMSCVGGVLRVVKLEPIEIHISYLPLAHIFETAVQSAVLCVGGSIGFFSGAVKTLTEDIKELKPTLFCGVPRVFARIHDVVTDNLNALPGIKRCVSLNRLTKLKQAARRGKPVDRNDKIMSLIRGRMGLENCRIIVTGAAPMPPYLMEFLRVVINPSVGVVQGYGMTETSAAVSISMPKDHLLGHVGPPLPSSEICLRDVPEMGYMHTYNPPCGEVLARGPSIFAGYFKNDKATAETLENGWIATGDIGRFNPNGTLSIIDRKKNMFKLAQGEYIASEKIEGVLARSGLVGQIWVYGNSYKTFVLAVVVPHAEHLMKLCVEKGWWGADASIKLGHPSFRDHLANVIGQHRDEITQAIKASCDKLAEEERLHGFEKPRDYIVEAQLDEMLQGFTVANDCLTPTFKLRRPQLLRKYEAQLRDLYTKHGEAPKPDEKW